MSKKNPEAAAIHAKIAEVRKKMILSDAEDQIQLYADEIAGYKEELRKINRKAPVVIPVKNGPTVGDKIERRLKRGGRKKASSFGHSRVKI